MFSLQLFIPVKSMKMVLKQLVAYKHFSISLFKKGPSVTCLVSRFIIDIRVYFFIKPVRPFKSEYGLETNSSAVRDSEIQLARCWRGEGGFK